MLKSKKMINQTKKPETFQARKYPDIVERIHHEFSICGEALLMEALAIVHGTKVNEDKINRLKGVGFHNVNEVKEGDIVIQKKNINEELARLIQYYQMRYPLNKFITKEQVEVICKKYKLVCGELSRFKGFVPEKNLREIENFNLKKEDEIITFIVKDIQFRFSSIEERERAVTSKYIKDNNGIIRNIDMSVNSVRLTYTAHDIRIFLEKKFNVSISGLKGEVNTNINNYSICAPKKDMNLKGLVHNGFFYFTKNITTFSFAPVPDPVVLQPVKGGYLILSAWGDEASDPIVVNGINN